MPLRRLLRFARMALAAAAVLFVTVTVVLVWTVPDVSLLASQLPERTSFMRVRAATLGLPEDRYSSRPMEVVAAAPLLVCAIIKSEDLAFFRHGGLDWGQLSNALFSTRNRGTGASTITQQLARNLYLGPEQTLVRKLREAFIARALEQTLSKHRILELYLNIIEWGPDTWGIVSAAQRYFQKAPPALDVFEVSFLSALVPAPRQPLRGANLVRAEQVQHRVLYQLYASGIIEAGDWLQAMARSGSTFACLRQDRPLEEALSCAPPPREAGAEARPPLRVRREAAPLPQTAWLETGCGMARDLREARRGPDVSGGVQGGPSS